VLLVLASFRSKPNDVSHFLFNHLEDNESEESDNEDHHHADDDNDTGIAPGSPALGRGNHEEAVKARSKCSYFVFVISI
jgi:hypothetical protein